MARLNKSIAAVAIALLVTAPVGLVSASPLQSIRDLFKRDPPHMLSPNASSEALRWQPSMDFDTDSCYNVPAIDAAGNVCPGLTNEGTGNIDGCRDQSDLENNNVYVRVRCNNGWCAYVYDYYFEKDVRRPHVAGSGAGGHRHEWEHIIVFVQDGQAKIVAASRHGDYTTRAADADDVRWDGTHVKIVYHKDGSSTHAFRFANADDDRIENHLGVWFRGPLVDYDGFPSLEVRDKLMSYDFKSPIAVAINDKNIKKNIDYARNGGAPGFDSGKDA